MNSEEIVKKVVELTTTELKKINDQNQSGFYMMVNSEFTGVIRTNNNELIIIQCPDKINYYKSEEEFLENYPSLQTLDLFLSEPYKTNFTNLVNDN